MQTKTKEQLEISDKIARQFGVDADRIYFFNPKKPREPWFPADVSIRVATQMSGFISIEPNFAQFIEPLQQVTYKATVTDDAGHSITRSGAATLGEHNGEIDITLLAESRAINAALSSANFDVVSFALQKTNGEFTNETQNVRQTDENFEKEAEAKQRTNDLKAIHAIAEKKGLIRTVNGEKDLGAYREWLYKRYLTKTAAVLDSFQRTEVINALENYQPAFPTRLKEIPKELWADSMVA